MSKEEKITKILEIFDKYAEIWDKSGKDGIITAFLINHYIPHSLHHQSYFQA